MFLGLALLLALTWAFGYLAFHVAGGLIHLLLLFAVVAFIVHMMRSSSRTIW